ncbi:MAG: hypothetical protein NTZ34_02675 [Chloroflexi bacterium]|nr:hypothetical protein [Chloroflexota bacterium]
MRDEHQHRPVTGQKCPAIWRLQATHLYHQIHPAVADAATVLKPGFQVTEDELLKYLSGHIHHYMAPKKIFFIKAMPKTGIGKIQKNEIRRVINE